MGCAAAHGNSQIAALEGYRSRCADSACDQAIQVAQKRQAIIDLDGLPRPVQHLSLSCRCDCCGFLGNFVMLWSSAAHDPLVFPGSFQPHTTLTALVPTKRISLMALAWWVALLDKPAFADEAMQWMSGED